MAVRWHRTQSAAGQREARRTGSGVANSQRMEVKVAHMQPRDDDALLTPSEVAAMFRVNPKTVTRWARAGKISAIRTLGGHRRFRASEIREFLDKTETEAEQL